jgi:hypothetical protein
MILLGYYCAEVTWGKVALRLQQKMQLLRETSQAWYNSGWQVDV